MSEALAHLFDDCAAAPGALGCGVRLGNRTCLVRSHDRNCTDEALEKSLHHLADAAGLVAGHGLAARRLAWTFASGKALVTTRADGALFVLLTRADADAGEFFDRMTSKFLAAA